MSDSKMIDSKMIDINIIESKMTNMKIIETEEIDEEEIIDEDEIIDKSKIIDETIIEILKNHNIANAIVKKLIIKNNEKYIFIKISKYDKNKLFIGNILVDIDDYENIRKYNWYISILDDGYERVLSNGNDKNLLILSHYICGKPTTGNIIDHLNNNSLDNRKKNLRDLSRPHNSQNREKIIKETTTSKFIGVCFDKRYNKWMTQYSTKYLGLFKNEQEAAIMYDTYVLIVIGKDAKTNNLVKYDEISDLTLEDILPKKIERDLPKNIIYDNIHYLYGAQIVYNKIRYFKGKFINIEEALKQLEIFKKEIKAIKIDEDKEHYNKQITKDTEGNAIIKVYNVNKEHTGSTIVDIERWHELSKFSWYFSGKYIVGNVNGKKIRLNRYLMNAPPNIIVDHIDNNKLNNKIENLRLATGPQNNYNTVKSICKDTTSIYKGVSKNKDKFEARVYKDKKTYRLGSY